MDEYNFITKIRNHEFSWREDYNQTMRDSNNLVQRLSPFYKVTGLDKLVRATETTLGQLDQEARAQVATAYALAISHAIAGATTNQSVFYIPAAAYVALGMLHHSAASQNSTPNSKDHSI